MKLALEQNKRETTVKNTNILDSDKLSKAVGSGDLLDDIITLSSVTFKAKCFKIIKGF